MKLKPKEEEFKRLSDFGEDLDLALKRAALQNDNFRVKVEGIERKLYMVTRDFLKKSEQVAMKEDQVNRFETELNEIKKNSADFGEVKRRLIALSKELTNGNHDDVDENETKSRMVGILKKEINSKRDIMKRQERLHENRMRKLKNDQKTLETVSTLLEVPLDSTNSFFLNGVLIQFLKTFVVLFIHYDTTATERSSTRFKANSPKTSRYFKLRKCIVANAHVF